MKSEAAKIRARFFATQWARKHPRKKRAQDKVYLAVKRGELKRPGKCSQCKKICTPVAHHRNYNRPLWVEWLCDVCHFTRHPRKRKK